MSVRLYKRSIVLKNIILFIILSFLYLHTLSSINQGSSALNYTHFIDYYSNHLLLVYTGVLTIFSIFMAKPISKIIFSIFSFLYIFQGVSLFLVNFNKFLLLFNFLYLVLAYYFYLFLKLELEEAIYRPSYNKYDVANIDLHNIHVQLSGKFGDSVKGHITSWDTLGCFIKLHDDSVLAKGPVGVEISFEDNSFFQRGFIVTSYANGVGVKFRVDRRSRQKTAHDWLDFYAIIDDMGLKPRTT